MPTSTTPRTTAFPSTPPAARQWRRPSAWRAAAPASWRRGATAPIPRCAPRPIPVDEQDGGSYAPPVSPVSLRQTIATAVYLRRRALGLSRRALAERCGVSLDTVQRVEADDDDPRARAPSVGVLERLAGGLGVPVAALVSEQNDVPSIVHK